VKIDIHTHILPKDIPDFAERFGYGDFIRLEHDRPSCARMMKGGEFFREVKDNCWDPGRRIEECDRDRVDVQVLSTVPVMFSYWAKPRDTLDVARFLNDDIADVVRANPKRFTALGTLPMQDAELAIGELERCVRELDLPGVQIGTNVNEKDLDDPDLFPVFERAEALGAAVFVHPWDMMARHRMTRYWLSWLVGMPAETALAICSVIFGGVLERLPKLRIGFAHGGGSFPGTFGRIEHGFQVRPDLCAVNHDVSPRSHLGRFYLDSLVHDAETLRFLIRLVGEEKIALGSDYPFPLGEHEPGRLIESMEDLTTETRERLLSGTALEFLDLERSAFQGS